MTIAKIFLNPSPRKKNPRELYLRLHAIGDELCKTTIFYGLSECL